MHSQRLTRPERDRLLELELENLSATTDKHLVSLARRGFARALSNTFEVTSSGGMRLVTWYRITKRGANEAKQVRQARDRTARYGGYSNTLAEAIYKRIGAAD